MVRKIESYEHTATLILMCGCRVVVDPSRIMERMQDCVWGHGQQTWIKLGEYSGGPEYSYRCTVRGCKAGRKYPSGFLTCQSAAQSHSRVHAHKVRMYAGNWMGREIVPNLLDVGPPY